MIVDANSITNMYTNVYSLSKEKIYLPIFQRGFSWSAAQTEKILENIDKLINDSSITLKQMYLLDFIGFRENGLFKLADGQQRIITLSILIKCLIDIANRNGIETTIENFDIQYDDEGCQKKWEQFSSGKIIAPFKKVYLRLMEYVSSRQSHITKMEKILMENVYVYMKMTENADDAFDIFEQINTGGKPLTKDEIITTIIRQYSNKYGIDLSVNKNTLKAMLTSYYKYLGKQSGTFNNLAIMSFLNTHVVKTKKDFEKFEKYIKAANTADDLPITYIVRQLNRTQLIDMIYAYESNGVSLKTARSTIENVFLPLCLLCTIFTLTGTNPGGKTKAFLDDVVKMAKSSKPDAEIQQFILDFSDDNKDICTIQISDFEDALRGKTRQNVLKALLLMDVIRSSTSGTFIPESINLEHIYPQKPVVEWSANGWPVNQDEQELYIHDIGNYLLLNEKVNKKIQNGYIDQKRDEYNRIIPKDIILKTPSNTVDFDEFEIGKNYIPRRRKEIAVHIRDHYPCAKAFIK